MDNSLLEYRLADCMEAIIDYRGKTPKKTTSGVPLVTAKIIKNGRINEITEYIAEADYDSWMRRGLPKNGDVVLTTEAPLGEVAQLDNRKVALAQRVITLRGKSNLLNNDYLKYLLQSPQIQHQLDGRASGTTVSGIKQSELKEILLRFPSIESQKKIAHVLRSMDSKLELNKKNNQTLEQMAQALFKSWFVDFDPVVDNALAAGNPIPDELAHRVEVRKKAHALADIQPLPEHIRNLFPNEFEQTGEPTVGIDGWVPSGWDIRVVYDLGVFINGAAYKKFEPNKEKKGIPIIKIAELKNGLTDNTGYSEVQMPEKYLLKDKDILFSWSGNPDTSIDTFVWTLGEAWLNQHIFKVEPRTICNYEYLLSLLKYLKPVFSAIARDKQTTGLGHVTVKDLKGIKIALPSEKLLESFAGQAGSIFERSYLNLKQSTELSVLRDYLLPKLISGEIQLDSSTESSINQEAELQGV